MLEKVTLTTASCLDSSIAQMYTICTSFVALAAYSPSTRNFPAPRHKLMENRRFLPLLDTRKIPIQLSQSDFIQVETSGGNLFVYLWLTLVWFRLWRCFWMSCSCWHSENGFQFPNSGLFLVVQLLEVSNSPPFLLLKISSDGIGLKVCFVMRQSNFEKPPSNLETHSSAKAAHPTVALKWELKTQIISIKFHLIAKQYNSGTTLTS